jgi:hypothetical protein
MTCEGISNKDGIYYHESSINDDYITIFACKPGYFPVQRTYIRERDEDNTEISKEIVVVMIKESFVAENNCIIMINYCNLLNENLEQCYQFSEKSKKN